MACSLNPNLGLDDTKLGPKRRLPARPTATAKALPPSAVRGVGSAATTGGSTARGDVAKLQQFMSSSAPGGAGPSVAELEQYHRQCQLQYLATLPPLPGQGELGHFRARRHLRRRQVDRPAPEALVHAAEEGTQEEAQTAGSAQQQQEVRQHTAPAAAAAQQAQEGVQQAAPVRGEQQAIQRSSGAGADLAQQLAGLGQLSQRQLGNLAELSQQQLGSLGQLSQQQLANLRQAAQLAKQHMVATGSSVSQRLRKSSAPQVHRRQGQQRQAQQRAAPSARTQPAGQQQQQQARAAQAAVGVAPPLAAQPAAKAGAAGSGLGRWAAASVLAIAAFVLLLLRWLRTVRRKAREAGAAVREAEQRARAGKLYDRQRQRFHRALAAAEDLEGADSSVFAAVSRKGSTTGASPAPGASGTTPTPGSSGEGNPFLRDMPADAAAVAAAAAAAGSGSEEDEEAEGSTDVFDPASWDEDVRKQWESFVSSSKVNKGKLWDTSQVDEGLPEVWVDLNR